MQAPGGLLASQMPNLGPGNTAEFHGPVLSRSRALPAPSPEPARHLQAELRGMAPGTGAGEKGSWCERRPRLSSAPQASSSLKRCDMLPQEPLGNLSLRPRVGAGGMETNSGTVEIKSGADGVTGAASGG